MKCFVEDEAVPFSLVETSSVGTAMFLSSPADGPETFFVDGEAVPFSIGSKTVIFSFDFITVILFAIDDLLSSSTNCTVTFPVNGSSVLFSVDCQAVKFSFEAINVLFPSRSNRMVIFSGKGDTVKYRVRFFNRIVKVLFLPSATETVTFFIKVSFPSGLNVSLNVSFFCSN